MRSQIELTGTLELMEHWKPGTRPAGYPDVRGWSGTDEPGATEPRTHRVRRRTVERYVQSDDEEAAMYADAGTRTAAEAWDSEDRPLSRS